MKAQKGRNSLKTNDLLEYRGPAARASGIQTLDQNPASGRGWTARPRSSPLPGSQLGRWRLLGGLRHAVRVRPTERFQGAGEVSENKNSPDLLGLLRSV